MYAVITTGGKQYKVKEGQTVKVEKLTADAGSTMELATLLISDEDGSNLKLGTPTVDGAKVTAKILDHGRAAKIQIVKYKPKSRYKRVNGHRQPFTSIQIQKIA